MTGFRKRVLAGALAAALAAPGGGAGAQDAPADAPPDRAGRLDGLLDDLATPGREDWERLEAEIGRLWSQSGSPAMDLLLRRGSEAIEAEDYGAAIAHLGALTDLAPDFAEGWHARATAFFLDGELALSMADIERTLALNPRHFGALEGLAAIFAEMDEPQLALRALRAAREINPNRPSIQESLERLEQATGSVAL